MKAGLWAGLLGIVCAGCAGEAITEPEAQGQAGTGNATAAGVGGGGGGGSSNATSGAGGAPATSSGSGGQTVLGCFADDFVNPPTDAPYYDQFAPVVGSHCYGTNHQDIAGVERVVFLGDSVTVGTPPHLPSQFYRSILADGLAERFGIDAANIFWKGYDLFSGKSGTQESGPFASCSEWGARTDDLAPTQLPACFGEGDFAQKTLVVMTMGGNDIQKLTQSSIDGLPEEELWAQTEAFVELQRQAIAWLKEPGRFPNGVYVVFANMYEFTDGTGEVESCDVSALAGFDEPVPAPEQLADMVIWANEQYVKMAVDHQVDVIFLLEEFCGHGFNADNPEAPCYRGPGQETWFDLTCIHPTPTGHQHIADMFLAVVDE